MVTLERVGRGLDLEESLELFEVAAERVGQLGVDRVLHDRVALLGHGLDVFRDGALIHARRLLSGSWRCMPWVTSAPQIDPEAFVHPEATIIGNVVIGPGATVWPQAVLRGDQSRIVIGRAHVGSGRCRAALHA